MLVERHWRVKITDFNLSRMVHTGEQNASVTSLLANNPRWLAPEVIPFVAADLFCHKITVAISPIAVAHRLQLFVPP